MVWFMDLLLMYVGLVSTSACSPSNRLLSGAQTEQFVPCAIPHVPAPCAVECPGILLRDLEAYFAGNWLVDVSGVE